MNLETKNDTSINVYYENFVKEELKMLYMPYIYVKNYIDIRYHKVNEVNDYYSGIIIAENNLVTNHSNQLTSRREQSSNQNTTDTA